MKHFNCLHPPEFTNRGTLIEAEEWVRQMKKIIDSTGITSDEDKVILTFFQLRSDADQ